MDKVCGSGAATWDKAVLDASEEYKCRPVRNVLITIILTFVFASPLIHSLLCGQAQSVSGQLPFPRRHGAQPHALRQQLIVEHGEPVHQVLHLWEACEVSVGQCHYYTHI